MTRPRRLLLLAALAVPIAHEARADDASAPPSATPTAPAAGSPTGDPDAGADAEAKIWSSCSEHVPSETLRPKLRDSFPDRALAGHAIPLQVTVEHGKGETVFPAGLQIQAAADSARALTENGFAIPFADGGAGPVLTTRIEGDHAVTDVIISFVSLPRKPGRHEQVLPPVPITLSRASGELVTVCTQPHRVVVDEPIANEPDAMPKQNPPLRPQRELWTLARDVTYGLLIGAAIAAVATWLVLKWLRRPKPVPPPPPPRPPWDVALEELDALRRSSLVAAGHMPELIDKASDVMRRYLGQLYGFDGIESTTDEVLQTLRPRVRDKEFTKRVASLLVWSDLVKFARVTPMAEDCERVLGEAQDIVHVSMPGMSGFPPGFATPESPPDAPAEPPTSPTPPSDPESPAAPAAPAPPSAPESPAAPATPTPPTDEVSS